MIIIVKFLIWHVNSMSEITVFSLKNRFVTSPKIQKIRFLEAKSGIIVMQIKPVQMSRTNFRQKSYFYGIEIDKAKIKIATNGIKADSLEQ